MAGITHDNHYLPRFYVKGWTSPARSPDRIRPESKLWVHAVKRGGIWKKNLTPSQIAYVHNGLTQFHKGRATDRIEREFSKSIDAPASRVLVKLVAGEPLVPSERRAWMRCVASMLLRSRRLGPSDNEIAAKWRELIASLAAKRGDSAHAIQEALHDLEEQASNEGRENLLVASMEMIALEDLMSKTWAIFDLRATGVEAFTGDDPARTTQVVARKLQNLVMALSPNVLLCIGDPPAHLTSPRDLVARYNSELVARALDQPGLVVISRANVLPFGAARRVRVSD